MRSLLQLRSMIVAGAACALACSETVQVAPASGVGGPGAPPVNPGAPAKAAAAAKPADAKPSEVAATAYTDRSFVENDVETRDPFRSFMHIFKVAPVAEPLQDVVMPETSLEEMRLVAIIGRIAPPKAMFLDKSNVGHIVEPGEYVGRAEVVRRGTGDAVPVAVHWRVYQVREDAVVLRREDPTNMEGVPVTRIIALNDEQAQRRR